MSITYGLFFAQTADVISFQLYVHNAIYTYIILRYVVGNEKLERLELFSVNVCVII